LKLARTSSLSVLLSMARHAQQQLLAKSANWLTLLLHKPALAIPSF